MTKKGRHYIFLRPEWVDAKGFWDGARQCPNGLEIDFKSLCATGTRGLLVVAPSTDKQWVPGRAPWEVSIPDVSRGILEIATLQQEAGRF